jgi:hypothetical protein
VYFFVAWAEGSKATGSVDRELFLASTALEYLVPGLAFLIAPILLALVGPWSMRPRLTRITSSDRRALRTFKYQRRELAGLHPIYARRRYALRVAAQIGLWIIGLVLLAAIILTFRNDHAGAEVNMGGFVALGLSGLGLLGALLMLPSRAAPPVLVDRDGNISRIESQPS